MENKNIPVDSAPVEPTLPLVKKNFFQKLSHSQRQSLLLIGFLALFLPVVTAVALLATRINPKAYLPATPPITPTPTRYVCPLTVSTVTNPCNLPQNAKLVNQDGKPLPSVVKTKGFKTVNFVCPDGFSSSYSSKTCQTEAQLKSYVAGICQTHPCKTTTPTPTICKTGVNTWTGVTICKTTNGTAGYMSATYQCHGSTTIRTASLGRCATVAELTAISNKVCANYSSCPSPTPTPTISVTPTPTATVSANMPPTFVTTSLPAGIVNTSYRAEIEAIDANNDPLNMTISGLPFGLYQGPCGTPITGGRIICTVTGTAPKAGAYSIQVRVTDNRGGSAEKIFNLSILNQSTPTPTPTN